MEVRLILMCSVLLPLSSCGVSDLLPDRDYDTANDDSSPSDTTVSNVINIHPLGQDGYPYSGYYNPQSDQNTLTDTQIDSLIKGIHRIERKMSRLDENFNSILKPNEIKSNHDFLHPNYMRAEIKNLFAEENKNCKSNVLNHVLANSKDIIKYLEIIAPIVQNIDQRAIQMYGIFNKHIQGVASELNRVSVEDDDSDFPDTVHCKTNDYRQIKRSNKRETTYRNVWGDRNQVIYEKDKQSCHELKARRNGIYKFDSLDEVSNKAGRFFHEQYCEFNTEGAAWTVIQRRYARDLQENFNRSWSDYKFGFGELDKEFWFGNDFIHQLTSDDDMELRIVLEDNTGRIGCAEYATFKVASEKSNYNMTIGGYRGCIAGIFRDKNEHQDFIRFDRQIDNIDILSCGSTEENGWWWLDNCTNANGNGVVFKNWLGSNFLKTSKLMVRPKSLRNSEYSNEKNTFNKHFNK